VSVIAVPVFALTWWAACYLIGRDPHRSVPWRAAAALAAYAAGVVVWTVAPESVAAQILLCVPALFWAGTAVALLPESVPERRQIDLGWVVLSAVLLVLVIALPEAGRLVALAPLAGGLVLLWRFRDQVRPPMLPAALTVAAALYAAGLVVLLLPLDAGPPVLVLAAIGLDLLMLGFLVAVAESLDAGERLRPDLVRAVSAAVVGTILAGGIAALTIVAADYDTWVTVFQFVLLACVLAVPGLGSLIRRSLDSLTFHADQRLQDQRNALLLVADALPRRRPRHRLITTGEDDFLRFTRQALDNFGDVGRLVRSPLIDLPAVDRLLADRPVTEPTARALALRTVLRESVDRLRPAGAFGTDDDWRYYNALHFCSVLGLDPHQRRLRTDGLDRETRQALAWMHRYVSRRVLRRWQNEGAALIALRLWEEMIGSDPRWLSQQARGEAAVTTRSTISGTSGGNG
jgi:hypothetical protein